MKYIITGTQLMILANVLDSQGIKHDLNELKPIEPMSDESMAQIIEHTKNIEGQYFLPFSFAREIERHILGRETS